MQNLTSVGFEPTIFRRNLPFREISSLLQRPRTDSNRQNLGIYNLFNSRVHIPILLRGQILLCLFSYPFISHDPDELIRVSVFLHARVQDHISDFILNIIFLILIFIHLMRMERIELSSSTHFLVFIYKMEG